MDNVPIVLAQYRLGKTLGIGAFGKVKSKPTSAAYYPIFILSLSGPSYHHGLEGGSENLE